MNEQDLNLSCTREERDHLLSPLAVRAQAKRMFDFAKSGGTHFHIDLDKIESASDHVIQVIKKNYPSLKIPFHSRWEHFKAGGIDRIADFEHCLRSLPSDELLATALDLVVVSVLLDAGAGTSWCYVEEETGHILSRSEGLAVASYHMFLKGDFSKSGEDPIADVDGLLNFSLERLNEGLQLSETNQLVGAESRVELLRSLGKALKARPDLFPRGRPGDFIQTIKRDYKNKISAPELLLLVLKAFGPIWPSRISLLGENMGDTWWYSPWGPGLSGLVPFHKLSQWLTYSLMVPIMRSGIDVYEIEKMTGLPEYRNGGLMLDSQILTLKDQSLVHKVHHPSSELIIEWRALTVALLDMIAVEVRNSLGMTEKTLPLGKVLEGGTWAAGRVLAQKLRGGAPPLLIESDGTVF